VYARFREKGRMLPDGVTFINSWVTADLSRCFQLMESTMFPCFSNVVAQMVNLIEFEIVPVVEGKETAVALARKP